MYNSKGSFHLERFFLMLMVLTGVCMLATSCAAPQDNRPQGALEFGAPQQAINEAPSALIPVTIQGDLLQINPALGNEYVYEVPMMTSEFAMDFAVGEFSGYELWIEEQVAAANQILPVKVERLDKEIAVTVRLRNLATGAESMQYIRTLPYAVQNYSVVSHQDNNGIYYFSHKNYILKMNAVGNIIFYRSIKMASVDFKKTVIGDKTYYSYSDISLSNLVSMTGNDCTGTNTKVIVLNDKYYPIEEIPFIIPGGDIKDGTPLDMNDFKMLDVGHYIIGAYNPVRVTNIPEDVPHAKTGARVLSAVFQEIKDGQLVFQWDSTEHPELYTISSESNDFYNEKDLWCDYMQWNSVDIDPADDNFVCSFRNIDAVLKIDRKTGGILWILGGKGDQFGLNEEENFAKQHDARMLSGGILSLFDNGNDKEHSRVIEFKLDEKEKKLLSYEEYSLENQFSPFAGNAQRIGDNGHRYVIGWGGRSSTNAIVSDVDYEINQVMFEILHPGNDMLDFVYRAYRFES